MWMADFYRVDPIATPKGTVIRIKSFEVVEWGGRRDQGRERPTVPPGLSTLGGRMARPVRVPKRIETLVSKSFYHLQKIAMVASLGSLFDSAPP